MRDEIDTYRAKNVQPFGVNPASVSSHQKYAQKFEFPFPLLSDLEREVTGAYGALKDDGMRIQRSVVLIEQDGKVLFAARGAPGPEVSLKALK